MAYFSFRPEENPVDNTFHFDMFRRKWLCAPVFLCEAMVWGGSTGGDNERSAQGNGVSPALETAIISIRARLTQHLLSLLIRSTLSYEDES